MDHSTDDTAAHSTDVPVSTQRVTPPRHGLCSDSTLSLTLSITLIPSHTGTIRRMTPLYHGLRDYPVMPLHLDTTPGIFTWISRPTYYTWFYTWGHYLATLQNLTWPDSRP